MLELVSIEYMVSNAAGAAIVYLSLKPKLLHLEKSLKATQFFIKTIQEKLVNQDIKLLRRVQRLEKQSLAKQRVY